MVFCTCVLDLASGRVSIRTHTCIFVPDCCQSNTHIFPRSTASPRPPSLLPPFQNTNQVEQLTDLSNSLTSLAIRPHPGEVSSDNIYHLASGMTHLRDLSLCPLPEACTLPDLQQLMCMPKLTRLQLGTTDAAQVRRVVCLFVCLFGALRLLTLQHCLHSVWKQYCAPAHQNLCAPNCHHITAEGHWTLVAHNSR